jgi:uncharacterized protein with ParB-like and HNH nuclease domain
MLRISQSDNIHGHFVGSVVYFQQSIHTVSDVPLFLVIDCQQQLTTITLLIAALFEFVKDKPCEIETNAVENIKPVKPYDLQVFVLYWNF